MDPRSPSVRRQQQQAQQTQQARQRAERLAQAPAIRGLEVGFVPHRKWPVRKWYYASPLWFYHQPYAIDEMIPTRAFYELVDDELKPLCRGLHEAGIHTTPSCQGHFYGPDRFRQVWDELTREQAQVAGEGLVVRDSETQESYLFHDPAYALPWGSFDEFYADADAQQGIGYIGILVPHNRPDLYDDLAALQRDTERKRIAYDDEIGQRLGAHLLSITVTPHAPEETHAIWDDVTQRILNRVHRHKVVER